VVIKEPIGRSPAADRRDRPAGLTGGVAISSALRFGLGIALADLWLLAMLGGAASWVHFPSVLGVGLTFSGRESEHAEP
jgi:hypothetical protein